jgi:hypothetical protein
MREFRRLPGAASILFILVCSVSVAQNASSTSGFKTIPVEQIHPGMQGVAYTVFQGT